MCRGVGPEGQLASGGGVLGASPAGGQSIYFKRGASLGAPAPMEGELRALHFRLA